MKSTRSGPGAETAVASTRTNSSRGFIPGERHQLLGLVDEQQHEPTVGREHTRRLVQRAPRFLPQPLHGNRHRAGQRLERPVAGEHRRQDDPFARHPSQPWQEPCVHQRGLAATGGPDEGQARAAASERGPQALEQFADLLIASEEHGGILGVERAQTRVRRARRIPRERCGGVEPVQPQRRDEPLEPFLAQLDRLQVVHELMGRAAVDADREHRHAPGAGQDQLGEAPARLLRSGRVQEHDGVSLSQACVELPLPVASRRDPLLGIEVQEQRLEATRSSQSATRDALATSSLLWLTNRRLIAPPREPIRAASSAPPRVCGGGARPAARHAVPSRRCRAG